MLDYIILGIIQGVTEFLPVSSSAHIIFAQHILGVVQQGVAVPLVLHLGTASALLVFFFKDIIRLLREPKWLGLILIVTVITGIIGMAGKDFFESLFTSVRPAAIALFATGIILIMTKKFMDAKRSELNVKDALILGITQGLAIIPGISRSGITMTTLLFRKLDRETSFRFSFLASIPAILGAALLEAGDINTVVHQEAGHLVIGFIVSFLVGLFALYILRVVVIQKGKLYYFGYYCLSIAIIALIFSR